MYVVLRATDGIFLVVVIAVVVVVVVVIIIIVITSSQRIKLTTRLRVEMWFLRRCFEMLKISRTEKKSNLEVLRAAGAQRTLMKTIRQRQLDFFGHVMRRQGIEALVVTGKIEGRRARGRQRLKYLDSLCTCLEDNVSPTQSSSGRQKTDCSGMTWSPTLSTTTRSSSSNNNRKSASDCQCLG